MASENILELQGISKRFGGVRALADVDLNLRAGEILALLGENGAGKSTLMKVLSGIVRPDRGRIVLAGEDVTFGGPRAAQRHGISIIHQEFSLIPGLSVAENIFFGREPRSGWGVLDRTTMRKEARELMERLGVVLDVNRAVRELSVAQQQFVEIAKALSYSARILVLDEPTATLSASESERLFEIMHGLRREGVAMIFISHHLDEIFQIADRVQSLRDGHSMGIAPLSDCTPASLVRMIAGRDIAQEFPPRAGSETGPVVLDVKAIQRHRRGPSVSFDLRQGEILGFAGVVGSGRTGLMRALVGADRSYHREVTFQSRVFHPRSVADARARGFGLVPEDRKRQGLVPRFSIADNTTLANLPKICHPLGRWLRPGQRDAAARDYINRLAIKAASPKQPVRELSGGSQQKVVIAKWLFAECQALIFDEPTRGVDVGAKAEIHKFLRTLASRGMAIIIVSSDLTEIVGMSDRVIIMRGGRAEHHIEQPSDITAERIMHYATGGHLA